VGRFKFGVGVWGLILPATTVKRGRGELCDGNSGNRDVLGEVLNGRLKNWKLKIFND